MTRLGAAIRRSGIAAIRHDTVALVSLAFLIVVVGLAIGADFLAPHSPTEVNLRLRNVPPLTPSEDGLPYLLGTDSVGRDIVSRLMHGARVSVAIGLSTVAIAGLFGVALGVVAGYRGGLIDGLVMRTVDVMLGLPGLLAALFVLFVIGPGLLNLILVLAALRWTIYTRVTRGMVLVLREQGYVRSSRSVGASDLRIMRRHILPNMISPLIVLATLEVGVIILAEAGLSFLGFGIQQPAASWGLDVAFGREYITSAWWVVTFPGLAILLTVLALNIFATSLRGVLDPLHRWRWATKQGAE